MAKTAADRARKRKVVGEARAETVPNLLVPDHVVWIAQLGAEALRDIVAWPELEAAGAGPASDNLRLDRRRMLARETLHTPAVESAGLEIEMRRLEWDAIWLA